MKPLLTLLRTDSSQVDALSVEQVLALCGAGKLTDNSDCCRDFREYLQITQSENLFKYATSCLQERADPSGRILQDIINELGRRLDYSVEDGLYQGRTNAIGFDGLWFDSKQHGIIIEVKTTDVYRINLDTIAGYRESLIDSGKVQKNRQSSWLSEDRIPAILKLKYVARSTHGTFALLAARRLPNWWR